MSQILGLALLLSSPGNDLSLHDFIHQNTSPCKYKPEKLQ